MRAVSSRRILACGPEWKLRASILWVRLRRGHGGLPASESAPGRRAPAVFLPQARCPDLPARLQLRRRRPTPNSTATGFLRDGDTGFPIVAGGTVLKPEARRASKRPPRFEQCRSVRRAAAAGKGPVTARPTGAEATCGVFLLRPSRKTWGSVVVQERGRPIADGGSCHARPFREGAYGRIIPGPRRADAADAKRPIAPITNRPRNHG